MLKDNDYPLRKVICYLVSVFVCFTSAALMVFGSVNCYSSMVLENCWMSHQNCLNHLWQIGNWSVNAISFLLLSMFYFFFFVRFDHDSNFPRLTSFFQFTSLFLCFWNEVSNSERKHLYIIEIEKNK